MWRGIIAWVILVILSGCGSGDPSSDGETGSCDVSKASPGETISCSVAGLGFSDDCTVFFGSIPVEVDFDDEEETIEWIIPPTGQGRMDITFQCGDDDPKTIKKGFAVIPSESGGDNPIPPPQDPPVMGNPTLPPQDLPAPGDIPPEPKENDPTPPPEDPPVPGTTELKISFVTSGSDKTEALHQKRLGLIRVHWKVEGGNALQQAYLYAPFNRRFGDTDCGKTADGRSLAVNPPPSAGEIADDSSNAEKYEAYLTGTTCTGDGDCQDYAKHFVNDLGTPVCRIELTELANSGTREGVFYTRMLIGPLKIVLAVQSPEGTWSTNVKEFAAPEAEILNPKVEVSKEKPSRIDVAFDFTGALSKPLVSGTGCKEDQVSQVKDGSGFFKGHCQMKAAEMNFIKVRVDGMAPSGKSNFNIDSRYYDVACSKPELTLTSGPFYKDKDQIYTQDLEDKGYLDLRGEATRICMVVNETEGTTETTQVPWVQKIEIRGTGNGANYTTGCETTGLIDPGSLEKGWTTLDNGTKVEVTDKKLVVVSRLPRNHNCTDYALSGIDFDGKKIPGKPLTFPYTPVFEVETLGANKDIPYYDTCNDYAEGNCGPCFSVKGKMFGGITWKGRHIKKISYSLFGLANITSNSGQPDEDNYQWQKGSLNFEEELYGDLDFYDSRISKIPDNKSTVKLVYTATSYDGETTVAAWKWTIACDRFYCFSYDNGWWDGYDNDFCHGVTQSVVEDKPCTIIAGGNCWTN